jgi:WD repeat-containing protein 1 (actin-interacting protein 1)
MQVGVLWTVEHMVSLSLNGNLNILDREAPAAPVTLQAHQVALTAVHVNPATNACYTASCDGVVCARSHMVGAAAGAAVSRRCVGEDKRLLSGNAHSNKVVGLATVGNSLVSVGWDDCLRVAAICPEDATAAAYSRSTALTGQPSGLASAGELIAVTTTQEVALYNLDTKLGAQGSLGYGALCVSVRPDGAEIAVGGDDNKTHIYAVSGGQLTAGPVVEGRSAVTSLAYSRTGTHLAIGDAGRQVDVYSTADWSAVVRGKWVFHTSKVTCLSWSPSDTFLASGSLDESIYIWELAAPASKTCIPFAHTGGVTGLAWIKSDTDGDSPENQDRHLVSVGNDQTVVTWDRTKA